MIPILMYHKISKDIENNKYTLLERDFENHLQYLYSHNYSPILVDDYYQSLLNPSLSIPKRSVIITFDDGHDTDYKIALSLLMKYNLKATFFITSDWVGRPGYMTAAQLKKLDGAGMSIQSHAKTHSFLDGMKVTDIYRELDQSKKILEDIVGEEVRFLSFPGGRYNRNAIQCAREISYSAMFSSKPYYFKKCGDIFLIGRYGIKNLCSMTSFQKIIDSNLFLRTKERLIYSGKGFFKKLLGNSIYYLLWTKYNK